METMELAGVRVDITALTGKKDWSNTSSLFCQHVLKFEC